MTMQLAADPHPTAKPNGVVSSEQVRQFKDEGYLILPGVIDEDMLTLLREECSYFLGYKDAQLDAAGETVDGITHKRSRYFISNQYRKSTRMYRFVFSELMADVCRATLGDDVYLFNEQWVVKGAEQGMKFAWHQDSGYVKYADAKTTHLPYLTCWCALDDVSEENGTVYILPHSRANTKATVFDHNLEEGSNDLIGYTGDDPGDPIEVPAGSIVAFSSYLFHRSGSNTTDRMRRIYLPQYSSQVIRRTDGTPWALETPFLKNGQNVYDYAIDKGC